jgi:hypothetical protein
MGLRWQDQIRWQRLLMEQLAMRQKPEVALGSSKSFAAMSQV